MEVANRQMLKEVPSADVIIVNPTHFSVALRYDENNGAAPRLVAKGVDHMALKIREIANANDVMIFEAPPLARALYHNTQIDQEIPEQLYMAVAQILAYVYQLKHQAAGASALQRPSDLPVPDELLKNDRLN
jgi:flagellar biosynthetic protein FlhB